MNQYQFRTSYSAFPPVVKNLLIINGLAFLGLIVLDGSILNIFVLHPLGNGYWPWQLVTYSFLHGGMGHLFFNMFALWMFGSRLELTWGSRRFVYFYFLCVIGAGLAHMLATPVPVIGASGGVFGILAAYGMLFPEERIMLIFPPIPMKAKYFVIGYGVLEFMFAASGSQPGVANVAHLGGLAVGALLVLYWRGRLPFKPARRTPY